jgi:TPR repeat protein
VATEQTRGSETRALVDRVATLEKALSKLQAQVSHVPPLPEAAKDALQQAITKVQDELRNRKQELIELEGRLSGHVDFQLQPAESGVTNISSAEDQALEEAVKRGSEAWSSGDYSKALALLRPPAIKGNPVAQHRLGVMYVRGNEVPQDYAQATSWFRKAADQGQGESQYSMGLRYLWGQGVEQDQKESVRWFKLAADQGVGLAAAALKNRYATGEGVPQDLVEACKWGLIAGAQADPSTSDLNLSELEGKLTPDQLAEAQRRAKLFVPKRIGPADP